MLSGLQITKSLSHPTTQLTVSHWSCVCACYLFKVKGISNAAHWQPFFYFLLDFLVSAATVTSCRVWVHPLFVSQCYRFESRSCWQHCHILSRHLYLVAWMPSSRGELWWTCPSHVLHRFAQIPSRRQLFGKASCEHFTHNSPQLRGQFILSAYPLLWLQSTLNFPIF